MRRAGAESAEERALSALRALVAKAGNSSCLECDQRGPTYVDVTIGSFVCSRCSGLLRGLTPPHRVKSISMATFTQDEMTFIKSRGNDYCRSIWMALFEGEQPKFKEEQNLKDFLSDKYEKKRYYYESNNNEKSKPAKEPIVVPQSSTSNETSIWSNIVYRQPVKIPPVNVNVPNVPLRMNTVPSPVPVAAPQIPPINHFTNDSAPRFPVDFSNADIYNASQLNNNTMTCPAPTQSSFASFDKMNTNAVVTPDRYAALADLDFTFRQEKQNQQLKSDSNKSAGFNPFESNNSSSSAPRNPFYTNNAPAVNGNNFNYPNPFIMGSSITPSEQSKNPFL